MSIAGEMGVEWVNTYEMGDPGVVVGGHDCVGGGRERGRVGRSGHRGGDSEGRRDARDENERTRPSRIDWGPQTINPGG